MTIKMLAIGILALMGLSSVMSPKGFRLFLGALGALCMALFFGFVWTGNRTGSEDGRQPIAKLQQLMGMQPDWVESATNRSRTILNDLRDGKPGDPALKDLLPKGTESTPKLNKLSTRFVGIVNPPITIDRFAEEDQQQQALAGIRARINDYLVKYRKFHTDVGVDKLTHRNLNPELIRWVGRDRGDGTMQVWLYFDAAYADHVRTRGRHVVMKQRLEQMGYAAAACGAILFLAFGILKVANRRNAEKEGNDYLQNSNVSMV